MKLKNFVLLAFSLILVSCNEIDLAQLQDEINNQAEELTVAVDCSTIALPDKTFGGSIETQGSDGVCVYITDKVQYAPNDPSFSNTDFCEFQYVESSTTHRMTVNYSDPENPTCTLSSSGGGGGGVSLF